MNGIKCVKLLVIATSLVGQELGRPMDIPRTTFKTIRMQVEAGSVVLRASDIGRLHGDLRSSATSAARQIPSEWAHLEGSTLVIRPPEMNKSDGSIEFTLEIPKDRPVSIVGAALAVRVIGFESALKIQTLTGSVELQDSIGPTSVDTETGNITVTLGNQPKSDLHLRTESGLINLSIDDGLSLRAHLSSGSMISWGKGVETLTGSLDRTIGQGGPILLASSRLNKIGADLFPSHLSNANPVVFRAEARWVYMNVIVRDQRERVIPTLHMDSFKVLDNGLPVTLGHFESTTEPFHLLLLFDVSGSIKRHAALIREAARQFIRRARSGDEFAVAVFSSGSRLVQPFTTDLSLSEKALSAISPSGGTAIYDAVLKSITEYMGGVAGRKAIVLFTDGIDNSLWGSQFGSEHSFKDLLDVVKNNDCLIYPIFVQPLPDPEWQATPRGDAKPTSIAELLASVEGKKREIYCTSETNPHAGASPCPVDPYQVIANGENNLSRLATETGGRLYRLRRLEDLASTYGQVANDLDTVYTLGFTAQPADNGEWHDLTVGVRDFPMAIVRTRRGYSTGLTKP